jgi:hypothetical protein
VCMCVFVCVRVCVCVCVCVHLFGPKNDADGVHDKLYD